MGEFIPQLVDDGKQPRVMLEYSGTLLHGLQQMGADDVFDALQTHHLRPRLQPLRGMARHAVGARRGAVHAGAGLPAARSRLAAPLRGHLRPGGAEAGARLLALRDGAAQPPGRRLRIRQDAERLRLPLGAGAGTHGRASPGMARPRSASTCRTGWCAATPRAKTARSSRSSRPKAATPSSWRRCSRITRPRVSPAGSWPARAFRRSSPRSPTARTAA